MDKYWKKNVLLNKTVANNLSLCVNNDGSNAKKGVSKSRVVGTPLLLTPFLAFDPSFYTYSETIHPTIWLNNTKNV